MAGTRPRRRDRPPHRGHRTLPRGDDLGALEQWNALCEPRISTMDVADTDGAGTAYLERYLGMTRGALLERGAFELARRRLADVPAFRAARLEYRPLASGDAEVRVLVDPLEPRPDAYKLVVEGLRSLTHGEARLAAGPFATLGDRWVARAAWRREQRVLATGGAAVLAPLRAVAALDLSWTRERYELESAGDETAAEEDVEEHWSAALLLERWIGASVRLAGGLGVEHWSSSGGAVPAVRFGARTVDAGDRLIVDGALEGWLARQGAVGRASIEAEARVSGTGSEWILRLGAVLTSASAPRTLWPGAGTGKLRVPLLRAHPLARDGRISSRTLAPRLQHATLERRYFVALGRVRAGAALFLDAARLSRPRDVRGARWLADAGGGVFVSDGTSESMLSLAHGDAGWVLSAWVGGAR